MIHNSQLLVQSSRLSIPLFDLQYVIEKWTMKDAIDTAVIGNYESLDLNDPRSLLDSRDVKARPRPKVMAANA